MHIVVALLILGFSMINVFGAWMVIRRKPWIAGLFMLAACILAVAAAALISAIPYARILALIGLMFAWLTSLFNAMIVRGHVTTINHVLRGVAVIVLYGLVHWVSR
ncbi:MAG: hypothetical protein AAF708_03065 [Deinococcota bacterium]